MAINYILYARPEGTVGTHLKEYWDNVKASSKLNHLFVRQYPPHVSLTSRFELKEVKKGVDLEKALGKAIAKTKKARDVTIKGLKQSEGFDRLAIESDYLVQVAKKFADIIALPADKRGKGTEKNPLHITLKQKKFKVAAKNETIQKMQKSLMKKIEQAPCKWSLCLYKVEEKPNQELKLTRCKKVML